MFNERAFIARVEAAEPDEFARLMRRPDRDQESALRRHFGDERFERMHELAARETVRSTTKRGNVVVIHGIMGGELTAFDRKGDGDRIWVHFLRLLNGAFTRLRLDDSGDGPADPRWDVRASGIYKRHYGEQLLRLSREWNVRAFWYDWRQDLHKAAAMLDAQIAGWFGPGAPVHLVAHSMGGLVARTFIADHPERWRSMWDTESSGRRGGRLVMLGTPNHGSFSVPQILTGLEGMVRKLAAADLRNGLAGVRRVVHTFPGPYQMLPSPLVLPEVEPLYRAHTYGEELRIPQHHLDGGRRFHEKLRTVVDPERMVYVAGYNQPTLSGIREMRVHDRASYLVTLEGDGRVPHVLGRLEGVGCHYVDEDHGALPGNAAVLDATTELLETGRTGALPDRLPPLRSPTRALLDAERVSARDEREALKIQRRAERLQRLRGAEESAPISEDERVATTLLLDGWLGELDAAVPEVPDAEREPVEARDSAPILDTQALAGLRENDRPGDRAGAPGDAPASRARRRTVRLRVLEGGIQQEHGVDGPPIDAIAVGHYIGVRPQFAEKALDEAISRKLCGLSGKQAVPEEKLLLTQYAERGTIRGELGQPFMLPDPREPGRLLVIAGMGVPGRFGAPEATVLARELVWTLDRLGRRHLATVLIGAGTGNLSPTEAVGAWTRGLLEALMGTPDTASRTLECITIVERDPGRVIEISDALEAQMQRYRARGDRDGRGTLDLQFRPLKEAERKKLLDRAVKQAVERVRRQARRGREDGHAAGEPTRVTVTLERRERRSVYRIGAITSGASVPEREIVLDERLVEEVNNRLPELRDVKRQLDKGRFLEHLLLREMRDALSTNAPLVLVLDSTTARIHWEMLAQPGARGGSGDPQRAGGFLGTARKLTRQLRTTFAPLPEPPPPAQRPLRALIVTDPAGDAPLPGASREGFEIADLFERFNRLRPDSPRRVEVRRLNGPGQATRHAVLEALFGDSYDILHFAGHCVFDADDPAASGWIFHDGRRLSANELRRVDRIPKFVFSNACESGITPDRADRRSAQLAPSFAEAFFERGVANFVCTAWPVGDEPARTFALHLYAGLLGLGDESDPTADTVRDPLCMQDAMHQARLALQGRNRGEDVAFWGAYQHYGSPSFRFFHASDLRPARTDARERPGRSRASVAEPAPAEA